MTIKTIRTQTDGTISAAAFSSLRVVGFHGQLGVDQTPARRAPVYANSKGHQVTILDASPYGSAGRHTLKIEVAPKPISEDTWTKKGTGTRVDPAWPLKLGDCVVIVGEREIGLAPELVAQARAGVPERVTAFLRWLTTGTDHSEELRCARVDGLVAWYTSPGEITALCSAIADLVRAKVLGCALQSDLGTLKSMSFWLSRAAVDDSDMFLAVAGLRKALFPQWEMVLHAGVRTGSERARLAAVDKETIKLASVSKYRMPSRGEFARRAVIGSLEDLPNASHRVARSAA